MVSDPWRRASYMRLQQDFSVFESCIAYTDNIRVNQPQAGEGAGGQLGGVAGDARLAPIVYVRTK